MQKYALDIIVEDYEDEYHEVSLMPINEFEQVCCICGCPVENHYQAFDNFYCQACYYNEIHGVCI